MKHIILFIITYIIIFLIYYFVLIRKKDTGKKKRKKKENKKPIEIIFLESRYNLDIKTLNYNRLLLVVAAVSSLDITIISTLIMIFDSFLIQILALLGIFPLILISYGLIGRIYKDKVEKGMKKDD